MLARSPIAAPAPHAEHCGWEISTRSSDAALTITDLTPLAKIAVRAPVDGVVQAALGVPFGRAARGAATAPGALVVGSGPGEWLLLAPPGAAPDVHRQVETIVSDAGEFASVVDLTHGRALVRLRGERSADLLAKVCAIDLCDEVTPDGAAFRSSVARLVTDVVRDDVGGVRSYLLHCERSSGQYLYEALLDAGAEFGIDGDGFTAPGI
jgi:heterotetrameric sarcosine oxidase gamma subunit